MIARLMVVLNEFLVGFSSDTRRGGYFNKK